jgi:hypothetical protein
MALLSTKALFLVAIIVVQATVFSPCPVQGIGNYVDAGFEGISTHFWHMFRITTMIMTLLIFTRHFCRRQLCSHERNGVQC